MCVQLRAMGHDVRVVSGHARSVFGRGQIIAAKEPTPGVRVWWGGSDGRGDGAAMGY